MASIYERLNRAQHDGPVTLLEELKELKNSVIGNVLRKVQIAEDGETLNLMINLLALDVSELVHLQLINEAAVILGSLANVGHLTLAPLLLARLPEHLIRIISSFASTSAAGPRHSNFIQTKLLPSLLRALRNILCSAADAIWGHMWGVGLETRVVSTGLFGYSGAKTPSKGKAREVAEEWRVEAKAVLSLVFETTNLNALLSFLSMDDDRRANPQILLPLFQMLAHLVALPSHRRTLSEWSRKPSQPVSSLLNHLLLTISQPASGLRSSAAAGNKLQIAALDLLASLVKEQSAAVETVKKWRGADGEPFMESLWTLVRGKEAGVRVAAAACLTNVIRGVPLITSPAGQKDLCVELVRLMPSLLVETAAEDRIRACFVLASLIKDESSLQEAAADVHCPEILISRASALARGTEEEEISEELRARYMESMLLALSALAFHHEPSRALIANAQPSLLEIMLGHLSHESYGVRAATCQLARALSRSVAILRTTLMDSGVGNGILQVLKRETERKATLSDERAWTVEVAATATLCNLVTDFSPMQTNLIETGGIELLAGLTKSEHTPLRLNALWALKNMTYRAPESVKAKVMDALGWDELAILLDVGTPLPLREQAIDIVRNLVADAAPTEIGRVADCIGYDHLLESLEVSIRSQGFVENLQAPAFWVLSNLALGPEKLRIAMTTRTSIVEGLSLALNERSDKVKVPAMMCLRHLIETNGKTTRPRPSVVALFQPYQLAPRLHELASHSPSLDVAQTATALLSLIRSV